MNECVYTVTGLDPGCEGESQAERSIPGVLGPLGQVFSPVDVTAPVLTTTGTVPSKTHLGTRFDHVSLEDSAYLEGRATQEEARQFGGVLVRVGVGEGGGG